MILELEERFTIHAAGMPGRPAPNTPAPQVPPAQPPAQPPAEEDGEANPT